MIMINDNIEKMFNHKKINFFKRSKYYDIVLTLDNRLVNAVMVQMVAMKKHLKRKIRLWILQSDFTDLQKSELNNFANKLGIYLSIKNIDIENYKNFNSTRLPRQTYFYLDAHNILPNYLNRALVMDVDTLILKDIAELYDIDFEDAYLAAGNEYENIKFSDYIKMSRGEIEFRKGNVLDTQAYCNSGVLLLNFDKFRKENIALNSFTNIINEKDYGSFFHDQIIINRFAKGNIKFFPRLYFNCSSVLTNLYKDNFTKDDRFNLHEVYKYYDYDEKLSETIIHYCGIPAIKPWKALKEINCEGKRIFYDSENTAQYKYMDIWWSCAEEIPQKNFAALYHKSRIRNHEKNCDEIKYLKSELQYFKSYTQIFRSFIEQDSALKKLVLFLKENNFINIAFFRMNQIVYALIPFFERNGISIKYVIENFKKKPDIVKEYFPLSEQKLPNVDLIIVMDVKNGDAIAQKMREKFKFKIMTIYELVADFQ